MTENVNVNISADMDLVWGAANIARELNLRNHRQAWYLLESGQIPGKKVGGRWVTSRNALRQYFAEVLSGEAA